MPEYAVWRDMGARCRIPRHPQWKYYGGRGITACERWSDFANFLADMGNRPSPRHTLDRIDNDGGYTPENCRWATRRQQMNNTRRNRVIEIKGEERTVTRWARHFGVDPATAWSRIYRGWDAREAVSLPPVPPGHTRS